MSHLFTKKFQSPLAYLGALSIVVFLSMLVEGYSYVQAKQIQINADLLVAGEVRTNNLCIGAVCRTAWPAGLLPSDVVAAGTVQSVSTNTACAQPTNFYGPNGCAAFFLYYYGVTNRSFWFDPRGVLTDSYSNVAIPCYVDPNNVYMPCGAQRTVPVFSGYSCSGGFFAKPYHPIASALNGTFGCVWFGGCQSAICDSYPTPPYGTPVE